jgi:hypothetical protein
MTLGGPFLNKPHPVKWKANKTSKRISVVFFLLTKGFIYDLDASMCIKKNKMPIQNNKRYKGMITI